MRSTLFTGVYTARRINWIDVKSKKDEEFLLGILHPFLYLETSQSIYARIRW